MCLTTLPPGPELERRARTTGALVRKRGVKGVEDLLRVALSYGFCNLSLEAASVWAHANGSAEMCKSAVLRRLRRCGPWLEQIIAEKLARRLPPLPVAAGLRVRLVDATRVSGPASTGQAWRVHAAYDPWERRLLDVVVTDNSGGERLDRFNVHPNDLVIADRGYAHRRGLAYVRASGGHFLVRTGWSRLPLETPTGRPFDLFSFLKALPERSTADVDVVVSAAPQNGLEALPCRLVVLKKPAAAAQEARRKAVAEAKRKGLQVDPRTLEACSYVLLLTSVSRQTLSSEQLLALYRLRWQIELEFKRLKSILELGVVRAKAPEMVRATFAAKLLGALLVEDILAARATGAPFQRAYWALTDVFCGVVKQAILGTEALRRWLEDTDLSKRWKSDAKRKRQPQCLATAALFA